MGGSLHYTLALMRMVVKSVASQRNIWLFRGIVAVLIHVLYIPVWFVMFSRMPNLQGWGIQHALAAYGLSVTCWGIVSLLAYGIRTLPQQIEHGELDGYLTLPQPILISTAICSSKTSGIGEIVFGVGICLYVGARYGMDVSCFPFFILVGSIVFASGFLLIASLGFWIRQYYGAAEELYFNFNLMSSRPAPIFTGLLQVITLTIFPVGLMTHVPLHFVETHQFSLLFFIALGVAGYMVLSVSIFYLGLKSYESGNRFGVRG